MNAEPQKAGDIADASEFDTPLEGIELPEDAQEAAELIENLTQEMKAPPFWCVKKGRKWRKLTPEGVRPYDHVALVIIEKDLIKQGLVKLRYKDSVCVVVLLTEMSCGVMLKPSEVEQQYRTVQPGHRDLRGSKH